MVSAEDQWNDAPAGHLVDAPFDVGMARCSVAVRAVRIAEVDNREMFKNLKVEIEVVGAWFVGGGTDGPRSETGSRPICGGEIEGSTDDGHVWSPPVEVFGVRHEWALSKSRQPPKDIAEFELFPHSCGEHVLRWVVHVRRLATGWE